MCIPYSRILPSTTSDVLRHGRPAPGGGGVRCRADSDTTRSDSASRAVGNSAQSRHLTRPIRFDSPTHEIRFGDLSCRHGVRGMGDSLLSTNPGSYVRRYFLKLCLALLEMPDSGLWVQSVSSRVSGALGSLSRVSGSPLTSCTFRLKPEFRRRSLHEAKMSRQIWSVAFRFSRLVKQVNLQLRVDDRSQPEDSQALNLIPILQPKP